MNRAVWISFSLRHIDHVNTPASLSLPNVQWQLQNSIDAFSNSSLSHSDKCSDRNESWHAFVFGCIEYFLSRKRNGRLESGIVLHSIFALMHLSSSCLFRGLVNDIACTSDNTYNRMSGEKGREWRAGGRKHGWNYIVKYTSDNHGKSMRKWQERLTREEKKMTVKKQVNREKKR